MGETNESRRIDRSVPAFAGAMLAALAAHAAGAPLGAPAATVGACLAVLVFGLPHGTFDIELLRREYSLSTSRLILLLAVYLAVAAAMYALWRSSPLLALVVFIAISVVHFSEDWLDAGSAFLARGMGAALLSAPALFHPESVTLLFAALTGSPDAGLITDGLLLIAPVSIALGVVAIGVMWQDGRRVQAVAGLTAVSAMTLLPPAIGFALFFCLFHSPKHFSGSLEALSWRGFGQWRGVVLPLTLAALGLVALLFGAAANDDLTMRFFAASFMTLSILVAPHMAVPVIFAAIGRLQHAPRPRQRSIR